jgi:SAM-dependent methyltransferase
MTDYLDSDLDLRTDRIIASAVDQTSFWAAQFGALMLEHVPMPGRGRVLDLACGTGFPLIELAGRFGRSRHCTGVDIERPPLERAGLKRSACRRADIGLVQGDAARLPFRTHTFTLITCCLGLNNFADPGTAIMECARVLEPGGRLIIVTNIQGSFAELYRAFRDVLADIGSPENEERLLHDEEHRGTVESIGALLEVGGFDPPVCIQRTLEFRFGDGSALLRHPLFRLGILPSLRRVVDRSQEHAAFNRVEDRLNRMAGEGGLTLTVPMVLADATRP